MYTSLFYWPHAAHWRRPEESPPPLEWGRRRTVVVDLLARPGWASRYARARKMLELAFSLAQLPHDTCCDLVRRVPRQELSSLPTRGPAEFVMVQLRIPASNHVEAISAQNVPFKSHCPRAPSKPFSFRSGSFEFARPPYHAEHFLFHLQGLPLSLSATDTPAAAAAFPLPRTLLASLTPFQLYHIYIIFQIVS